MLSVARAQAQSGTASAAWLRPHQPGGRLNSNVRHPCKGRAGVASRTTGPPALRPRSGHVRYARRATSDRGGRARPWAAASSSNDVSGRPWGGSQVSALDWRREPWLERGVVGLGKGRDALARFEAVNLELAQAAPEQMDELIERQAEVMAELEGGTGG